jgi:signal recognition particle subunit SRP54
MLDSLTKRLGSLFSGLRKKGRLSESDVAELMREIRIALLEADVNFKVAKDFVARVKEKASGEELFGSLTADQTLIKIVRDELVELLGGEAPRMNWSPSPPTVILMCGLQGSGKTTTCAKLAARLAKEGKKCLLAACDVQRPAAIKQLQVLGEQIGAPVYSEDGGSPVDIALRALERCRYLMIDVLIVDTAGRLTIDESLMQELREMQTALKPSEVFLVLDSTTGQEAVNVSNAFHERLSLSGVIFTKLDGDARGGAVLSVREATGVPVRYVGVGEQVDMIDVFHPDRMAQRILGMGDILGIIEKAELAIEKEDAQQMQAKFKGGSFDFNDMLSNFRSIKKMGPLKNVLKMIPGLANAVPEEALSSLNDNSLNRIEAMILSMTPKERANPDILNGSRRKRIAAGSGRSVEEVNQLIRQLYEFRKQMKEFGKLERRMKKHGRRR